MGAIWFLSHSHGPAVHSPDGWMVYVLIAGLAAVASHVAAKKQARRG